MGSGCGSELAWWFGLEANSPKKTASRPAPRPEPPAQCRDVIAAF
jgi:murein endopeptidase